MQACFINSLPKTKFSRSPFRRQRYCFFAEYANFPAKGLHIPQNLTNFVPRMKYSRLIWFSLVCLLPALSLQAELSVDCRAMLRAGAIMPDGKVDVMVGDKGAWTGPSLGADFSVTFYPQWQALDEWSISSVRALTVEVVLSATAKLAWGWGSVTGASGRTRSSGTLSRLTSTSIYPLSACRISSWVCARVSDSASSPRPTATPFLRGICSKT